MQHTVYKSKGRPPLLALLALLAMGLSSCAPSTGIFAGGNWQSSGLQHQHIRTLAVDSNNPQAVYAGDADGQVFASTDGGQHWTDRSLGLPPSDAINALLFDPSNKKLYAATEMGLFVSTDAAQHWSAVPVKLGAREVQNLIGLAFDLNAPHTIYISSSLNVFMSRDDGNTWSNITYNLLASLLLNSLPANSTINNLTFESAQHRLWAATDVGIFRLDSGSIMWQTLNVGLPATVQVYTVQPASVSGGDQNLVFAGTSHGVYQSQDSGARWIQNQVALERTTVKAVFVDFRTPTTVYVGTNLGAFRSDDSGQNWGGIGQGLPTNEQVYAIQLGATDNAQLIVANNDVYEFPGSSGGFDATRILPYLVPIALFVLLYYITSRSRRARRLKPERITP
jgi:photosystem II stability/assembly factor-like uncharacterized protein